MAFSTPPKTQHTPFRPFSQGIMEVTLLVVVQQGDETQWSLQQNLCSFSCLFIFYFLFEGMCVERE